MGMISTFDGGVFVHNGTDLCVRCCDAEIVVSGYRDGEWNHAGLNKDGGLYWRFETAGGGWHPHIFFGHIWHACVARAKKFSLEGNLMESGTYDGSKDCVVDSSGNIYTCGAVYGSKNIRKYNSSGVLQWSVNTGATCYHIALNHDETMVVAGGELYTAGGPPYYNLWVRAVSDGGEVMKVGVATTAEWVLAVGWDAFDNIYVLINITSSSRFGYLIKLDIGGNELWRWSGVDTGYIRSMVVGSEHVYVCKLDGKVLCFTKTEDPDNPGEPKLVWSEADRGGDGIAIDSDEHLFTISYDGDVRELDPSDGDILWTVTNVMDHVDPADGWRYRDIHAGGANLVATWALSNQYYAGDVVIWDGEIYRSLVKHISGGDAQWVWGGTYAIGDRCYWMDPNDTAYILENNAKGAADTTPPSSDADWVEDDDEPGVGNNWEDYWEIKT